MTRLAQARRAATAVWRAVDPGLIVAAAIGVAAAAPFFTHAGLPNNTDAELHIFRLAELQRMVAGGSWYPRWAANFYYGYGYPIFNYYAPLTYYLGLGVMALAGVGAAAALKLLFVAALPVAAVGMYGLARDRWGRPAGLAAAASYVFAPYLLFIDPHARGVLPELLSLAIFPTALWALDRLRARPAPGRLIASAVAIAAVVLLHNLMTLILGPLLFVWAAAGLWDDYRAGVLRRSAVWTQAAVFPLGLGLAAFFWLPMLAEQDAIQIASVIGPGSHYDYRTHFLTLRELLGPSRRLDWSATAPHYAYNLGLVQWVAGLVGVLGWLGLPRGRRAQGGAAVLAAALLIWLMLPSSQAVWAATPGLPYLQFPWRLLGPAAAMLALTAGMGIGRLTAVAARRLVPVLVGMCLVAAWPLTDLPPWQTLTDTSARAVLIEELLGRWRGTTSTADFVPATVINEPREEPQVLADFFAEREPERLNRAALGAATVDVEILSPVHARYRVDTPDFLVLRLYRFAFPGWRVWIDGQPGAIVPSEPEGWITIPLEAGRHLVELRFGSTPPRTLGWVLAGSALATLAGLAWRLRATAEAPLPTRQSSWDPAVRRALAAVCALAALQWLVLRPLGALRIVSPPYTAHPAAVPLRVSFDGRIALLGFDAPPPTAWRPGRDLVVTLYWQAERPLDQNYQVFVHLLRFDPQPVVAAQSDKLNPGDFPTKNWPLDRYVRDAHRLALPADLPPGRYLLTAGLYHLQDQARLRTLSPPGEWAVLGEIAVGD